MTSHGLDVATIEKRFISGAIKAADAAADRALVRIQRHAPVRKLFRGTTTRVSHGYKVPRQFRFRTSSSAGGLTGRFSRDIDSQGELLDNTSVGQREGDIRFAHPNSEEPVFRFRTTLLGGDFRRLDEQTNKLMKVQPFVVRRGQTIPQPKLVSGDQIRGGRNEPLLTSRGKFEVRAGRANFRSPDDGQLRVGGRLKGELYIERATHDGSEVWAYVVSPTKDPETGYPYNRAQEFGTIHNRAHPFMRPGLRETSNDLVREARRNVSVGRQ